MSRSVQLRQLAVQLASLASLEEVVTHGLLSFLESPARLVASISVDERAPPASLSLPRSRSHFPYPRLLPTDPRLHPDRQGGPTCLAVKSCPPAPPERSGSRASAVSHGGVCERGWRGPHPSASAAPLARRSSSGATEAGRRSHDKTKLLCFSVQIRFRCSKTTLYWISGAVCKTPTFCEQSNCFFRLWVQAPRNQLEPDGTSLPPSSPQHQLLSLRRFREDI